MCDRGQYQCNNTNEADPYTLDSIANNKIHKFVSCFGLTAAGTYKCLVDGCQCAAAFSNKSNAIRHLRTSHRSAYDLVSRNKAEVKGDDASKYKTLEIRVAVNVKEIWDACVDLIVVNALPLSIVESAAFKRLLEPYVIALKKKDIDLKINRQNIKKCIDERAEKIREKIRAEIRNKPICLMVDIGSKFGRSILGVTVAFFDNAKVNIRTIGMHELRVSHTGENLVEVIKQILEDFNISLSQILSITSDNGRNLIKAIALLDALYQEENGQNNPNGADHLFDHSSELLESESGSDDEDIDTDIFNDQYYTDLLANVRASLSYEGMYTDLIHGVSCAAHCFHLVILQAIEKCQETTKLLDSVRGLAKKLRTSKFRNLLKANKLNQAKIDQDTRWNSIFNMVERLCSLKNFCLNSDEIKNNKNMTQLMLDASQWDQLEQLMNILRPFNKYTIQLQSERCTLSDFYGFWTILRLKTARYTDTFSSNILQEMQKREKTLLENPFLVSAVFMDPRYQRALTNSQKTLAICHLAMLYKKIEAIERQEDALNDSESSPRETSNDSSFEEMQSYLDSLQKQNDNTSNSEIESTTANIEKIIGDFNGGRCDPKIVVLNYWEKRKSTDPELYKLANAVFTVPPTQTTVERCFSALAIVLSSRRTKLGVRCLHNILINRLNRNICPVDDSHDFIATSDAL